VGCFGLFFYFSTFGIIGIKLNISVFNANDVIDAIQDNRAEGSKLKE
jgi:hypothetical protein